MSESTLSIKFTELQIEVADFLGLGRASAGWDSDNTARIASYISEGLHQFYYPPKFDPNKDPHKWSFLTPTTSLVTVADTGDYDLPDNFGSMVGGRMSFDTSFAGPEIQFVGEASIRSMRQGNTNTGKPQFAAVRPKVSDGTTGQRWEIMVYPTPDDAYTVYYKMRLLADAIESGAEYPYGGMAHRSTLIASCLSVAELRMDNIKGAQWEQFIQRLTASIEHDYEVSRIEYFGYNGDNSGQSMPERNHPAYIVTVDGVNPWEI